MYKSNLTAQQMLEIAGAPKAELVRVAFPDAVIMVTATRQKDGSYVKDVGRHELPTDLVASNVEESPSSTAKRLVMLVEMSKQERIDLYLKRRKIVEAAHNACASYNK